MGLPVLLWGHVPQSICRPLLVEEPEVFVEVLSHGLAPPEPSVDSEFRLDPAVEGFRRHVVRRDPRMGHRSCGTILGKELVERLRGVYGALAGVQDHF